MSIQKRPLTVTVVAWVLIVSGVFTLLITLANRQNPQFKEVMRQSSIPGSLQWGVLLIGLLITIISGWGLLKRQNWARYLYVVWNILAFIYSLMTSPMRAMLVPSLIIFAVITVLLFRPNANQYFTPTSEPTHA